MPAYSDNPLSKRKEYELIRSELWTERASFDAHWRDLSDFIRPRRTRFVTTDRNRGDKRSSKIVDSSATFASQTLRAGMHGGMSSPARPWVKLSTPDPDLAEMGPIKEWLHIVTRRMLTVFASSNLYNGLPILYGDAGDFATGAMGIMEDDAAGELFRVYPYPVGSYAAGVDARGVVNTFIREWQMTVRQIVAEYCRRVNPATGNLGTELDLSNLSQATRNLWDRQMYQSTLDVCWIVAPNEMADPSKARMSNKHRLFHSCYFEKGQEQEDRFLRESGFHEFPVILSRWERTGEDTYGTSCPGMIALGDIKALQVGERQSAKAIEKQINPPVQAPTHIRNQKVSLLPGDITYADVREGQKGITPIHEINFMIDKHEQKQQSIRMRIQQAYYADLFLMLANDDRMQRATAREVEERHEEKLIALGPVVEGQKDDVHDPVVDRVFAMMTRAGLIPPPPKELTGVKLKVEYLSLLSQAQKLVGIQGIERFTQYAVTLAEVVPTARHKVNWNQLLDDHAEATGINPKSIVPDDEAKAAADAEQQALAQQQAAETMQRMSQSAAALGKTPMDENSALSRVIDGQAERVG